MYMKKTGKIIFLNLCLMASYTLAHAETLDFDLKVKDVVSQYENSDPQFNLNVEKISGDMSGVTWKIRAHCEGSVSIKVPGSHTNLCYKDSKLKLDNNAFSFILKNKKNASKKFSIELKAFDAKGKFIQSEFEKFSLK